MAWQKYGTNPELDRLVTSYDCERRRTAAKQGYGLDILINDEEKCVRELVAEQGYDLAALISDGDKDVRAAVARHGYGLEILINDESAGVRMAVARQGYGLNILINDKDWFVRSVVAKQGYGLDILVNDENKYVCEEVKQYLEEHNYKSLEEWIKQNPDKVHNNNIDFQLANDLKDFIYKINESSKLKVHSEYDNIDDFFINNELNRLVIWTVDTNLPLIIIDKSIFEQKISFQFSVNITNRDGDNFIIKTTIKSKEQLITNLENAIEALRLYPEFNKYVTVLENCL